MTKTMKFTHDYMKLMTNTFSTIRRMPYWADNEEITVNHPSGSFKAKIISSSTNLFKDLSEDFLIDDVWLFNKDKPSYEDAVLFIENLLGKKISAKTIFIKYYLRKVVDKPKIITMFKNNKGKVHSGINDYP